MGFRLLLMGMKPDSTDAASSRAGLTLDDAARVHFLEDLVQIGNSALAAQTVGRTKNGRYEHRERDPHDARRVFISLQPEAVELMRSYFGRVAEGLPTAA